MIEPTGGRSARGGREFWRRLASSTAPAIVGGEEALRRLAIALLAEGHALIEDVPGTGKTTLARAFARSLGLGFARVQGTPDLLPGDVTGSSVLDAGTFRFVPGPVFTNVLLFDEVNRATPRTQSALLEAMQERQVSVDGVSHRLPEPFLVVATQNPIELEGTFALPEAQLDRFLLVVTLGYPDEDAEIAIAGQYDRPGDPLDKVEAGLTPDDIAAHRAAVRAVAMSDDVARYVVRVVRATRDHADVRLGGSPRASVALHRASQGAAYLSGREFVLPDDVVSVAPAVLAHRLLLDVDRELRGATREQVIADVLGGVPVPMPTGP